LIPDLDWAEKVFGYRFQDSAFLEAALTHRSAGSRHNERLEFLGDALLNFVIADELYRRVAQATEGDLSRLRASLVKGGTLAALARSAGLGDQLKLGSGELKSGGFRRESILADALEALIGAMLLDGGVVPASEAIRRIFRERLENLPSAADLKDPKTRLQELLQARGLGLPVYTVQEVQGAAHNQRFQISCQVADLRRECTGHGTSRRKAEQAAASNMLEVLKSEK